MPIIQKSHSKLMPAVTLFSMFVLSFVGSTSLLYALDPIDQHIPQYNVGNAQSEGEPLNTETAPQTTNEQTHAQSSPSRQSIPQQSTHAAPQSQPESQGTITAENQQQEQPDGTEHIEPAKESEADKGLFINLLSTEVIGIEFGFISNLLNRL